MLLRCSVMMISLTGTLDIQEKFNTILELVRIVWIQVTYILLIMVLKQMLMTIKQLQQLLTIHILLFTMLLWFLMVILFPAPIIPVLLLFRQKNLQVARFIIQFLLTGDQGYIFHRPDQPLLTKVMLMTNGSMILLVLLILLHKAA